MRPAPISEITNLAINVFVDHGPSYINHLLFAQLDGFLVFVGVGIILLLKFLSRNFSFQEHILSL